MNSLRPLCFVVALSTAMSLVGCGGDSPHVRVELDLTREPCDGPAEGCTERLVGSGIVFETDAPVQDGKEIQPGISTLYAEAEMANGNMILLEIGRGESGLTEIKYREIKDGDIVFRGRIINDDIETPLPGEVTPSHWSFKFDAENQLANPDGTNDKRFIRRGRIVTVSEEYVDTVYVDQTPSTADPRSTRVVVVTREPVIYTDTGGCENYDPPPPPPPPPEPYDPDPTYPDPDPNNPDVTNVPDIPDEYPDQGSPDPSPDTTDTDWNTDSVQYDSGGGCDGDTGSSSSSSCEGDTSSSSSCEGDSSGGDCDGCEGDTYASLTPEQRAHRAALSLIRLTWPIALVGWFNRRRRRKKGLLSDRERGQKIAEIMTR